MSLIEQIAQSFQLSVAYVRGVAGTASHRYKQFSIKKADGKSDRKIEQPSKELKLLQRWLVRRVFDHLPTHPCAHAYVKGRSIGTNASVHRGSRFISRLDLENFFPSLTSTDVELLLSQNRKLVDGPVLSDEDIRLVSALTCRFGRLTIGAPSSPTISNKLLYALDTILTQIAEDSKAKYTRYADDLYFSSSQPEVLFDVCKKAGDVFMAATNPRLTINKKKTYHASRKKRMAVTGLRITPEGDVSVGHDLKRRIRVFAHKASKKTIGEEEFGWLRGMLAYVSSIEPQFAERIRNKYGLG
jgi:RNA-directed DNA polymerase